jgi:N-acetylmuramoyl-L-alanine amidase
MRTDVVHRMRQALLLVILLGVAAGGTHYLLGARAGSGPLWLRRLVGVPITLENRHIGIVAGHSGNDSGTICLDGLTEVSVNEQVAGLAVHELRRRGATADLLQEFDPRLQGYQADAFISIHVDSCRVDSLEGGSGESGRLTNCLWKAYAAATGLKPHPDTITYDMTDYHAFREIASLTPAAIIELGFLNADRPLLTRHPDRAAAGVVAGLECFLAPPE